MTKYKFPTLYKRDSKGKVRLWWVEVDEDQYRVVSGLEDGKLVESDWKTATPKNVGRSNETTGSEQALAEKDSLYEKQLKQGKYHESKDTIDEDGYFEPMLAEKWNDSKDKRVGIKAIQKAFDDGVAVYVQPKLDGIRNLATVTDMRSREGEERVSCPHVLADVRTLLLDDDGVILDGELYNHEYHNNFNKLQSLILQRKPGPEELAEAAEKVQYHVYDAFFKDNPDLLFSERIQLLQEMDLDAGDTAFSIHVIRTERVYDFDEIDRIYGELIEAGYEGMIIRIDGPYENRRTKNLIKRKEFFDEEFEIVDILEGEGNWNGKAKAVKFKAQPGDDRPYDELPKAGIRGNETQMSELLKNKGRYIGGEVTVRFPNKTPGGDPRFGVAVAFYEGKRRD